MADLPTARRMRRFRDPDGREYDEIPDGRLRRRLQADDPSPLPAPQYRSEIEHKAGPLEEIKPAALAKPARDRRRRCSQCGKYGTGTCCVPG